LPLALGHRRQAKRIEADLVTEGSEELSLLQLSPETFETATKSPAA
jgi:hypothetical protein